MSVPQNPKFGVGDLVTYRKDLLGVDNFSGVIINVFCEGDGVWYAFIKWIDGGEFPEMFRHIELLAKAKDEQKK